MTVNIQEVGRRLRLARESCGLPQATVAGKIGLGRREIAAIEAGTRPITSTELEGLAWLYGREVGAFLSGEFRLGDPLAAPLHAEAVAGAHEDELDARRNAIRLSREWANLQSLLGQRLDLVESTPESYGDSSNEQEFHQLFKSAALVAYRLQLISRGKLFELLRLVGLGDEEGQPFVGPIDAADRDPFNISRIPGELL